MYTQSMEPQPTLPIQSPPILPTHSHKRLKIILSVFALLLMTIVFILLYRIFTAPIYDFYTDSPPPIPQKSPSPTLDETTEWKTYRNDEYGFEFQYPDTWFFQEPPNWSDKESVYFFEVGITPEYSLGGHPGNEVLFLTLLDYPNSLETYRQDLLQLGEEDVTVTMIQIDSKPALKIHRNSTIGYVFKVNNDFMLSIGSNTVDQTTIDQILSSFRFVEEEKTNNFNVWYSLNGDSHNFYVVMIKKPLKTIVALK